MNLSSFFKLVEIRTKVASIIPFILGALFTFYRYGRFRPVTVLLFFLSMICIDLATTAINNFMDFKRAIKKDGYNYEEHNAMVRDNISEKTALTTIYVLLILATIFGVILFLQTDWVVLVIGFISFSIGVLYSSGPLPIYRTPLGELFSGVIMGGFIFFITTYIQIYDIGIITGTYIDSNINLTFDLKELVVIGFISLPLIFMISNIMLANNICDIEDDKINLRYTLPIYIGKKLALKLYILLYIFTYLVIIIGVIIGILPVINLVILITLLPLIKNIKVFYNYQDKATTFVYTVKNFMLISGIWIVSFLISIIINVL